MTLAVVAETVTWKRYKATSLLRGRIENKNYPSLAIYAGQAAHIEMASLLSPILSLFIVPREKSTFPER